MKDQASLLSGTCSKQRLFIAVHRGNSLLSGGNPRDVVMFPTQFRQSAASASPLTAVVPCSLPRSK